MKPLIYQVLPRLFGNKNSTNRPAGSLGENGCGKLSAINTLTLRRLHQLGYTHLWLTGLLRHATKTDYSHLGITPCCPDVVKGKAGSPYAITDYYDLDPDLATEPAQRMEELEALLSRAHRQGLGIIMDFVPNHVARQYHSNHLPAGVEDLGAGDDPHLCFSPRNDFYYCQEPLHLENICSGSTYHEEPARATGNDQFHAWPSRSDWYETVKLNYGVDYCDAGGRSTHFSPPPSTWQKMTDILLFWARKGVDGFRCDMAEMVPSDFWHYALGRVREEFPDILFIAEVYNPALYREYIHHGGFDYLYDKVGLYDTLLAISRGECSVSAITRCWQAVDDVQDHMLNFLENHDEQRLASTFCLGEGERALPALAVSALMGRGPFMVYAGQEVGEAGMEAEGFSGLDGRTTIFDYWSPKSLRTLAIGPSALGARERRLYDSYARVLQLARGEAVAEGLFYDLMYANQQPDAAEVEALFPTENVRPLDSSRQYAFLRRSHRETLLVVANFTERGGRVALHIPYHAFAQMDLPRGECHARDLICPEGRKVRLALTPDGYTTLEVPPLGATALLL